MPPLRDTVRLIHGVEGDLDLPQQLHVLLAVQGLGGYVEELGAACDQILLDLLELRAREGRVEEVGYPILRAVATYGIHLILHQSDQGGEDDRRPLHQEGRQLIAETLPATRRHEDEAIASSQRVLNDRELLPLEGVEAEGLLEGAEELSLCHSTIVCAGWMGGALRPRGSGRAKPG